MAKQCMECGTVVSDEIWNCARCDCESFRETGDDRGGAFLAMIVSFTILVCSVLWWLYGR
jgi:hypothetical protein